MLRLLCARPHRLWKYIIEGIRDALQGNRNCILLVPEQYTLQAERNLIEDLQLPGLSLIHVISPSRLQKRVFENAGAPDRVILDKRGKQLMMARALEINAEKLQYYRSSANGGHKTGFIRSMTSMISSMQELNLTADALREKFQNCPQPPLKYKMEDLALILDTYTTLLGEDVFDGEHAHFEMLTRMSQGSLFENTSLFVYGFDMISPSLEGTLVEASKQASDVLITLVAEKQQAEDGRYFSAALKTAQRLMSQCSKMNINHNMVFHTEDPLQAAEEIQHLERYLLGYRFPPYMQTIQSIRLFSANTPFVEAEFVARQAYLEIERGVSPDDILIYFGNMDEYGSLIASRLSSYGVPCFLSKKQSILSHGAVRCLLSVLRFVGEGWQSAEVDELISSGFSSLTEEEGWLLKNYIHEYGINGPQWKKTFTRGEDETRNKAEQIRAIFMEPLLKLHQGVVGAKNTTQSINALMGYMNESGLYHRILELADKLSEFEYSAEALISQQVWKKLIETFEQMAVLLADERIPLSRFSQWLEAALIDTEIASLPPEYGCIHIGEIGKLLPHRPKVVIFAGANEGIFSSASPGLLNDQELEMTGILLDAPVGMQSTEREGMRLMDFWKSITAAEERLYITYALSDEEGSGRRPLAQINNIKQLFPGLIEEGGALFDESAWEPVAPLPALDMLSPMIANGSITGDWADAWNWLYSNEFWTIRVQELLDSYRNKNNGQQLPKYLAHQLFDTKSMSVSRLESFAACPYRHFVDHGLRPYELKEWEIQRKDSGTFYHQVMQRFTQEIQSLPHWPEISEEENNRIIEEICEPITQQWDALPFGDTQRARSISAQFINVCRKSTWMLTRGMKNSSFRPDKAELSFGKDGGIAPLVVQLDDGSKLTLRGTIDRVDLCKNDGKVYIRVIDYKSGNKEFSPSDIYAGLQLQLLIYTAVLLETSPHVIPAGMFYQELKDPLLTREVDLSEAEADEKIASSLRMNGLSIKDAKVFELMDCAAPPLTLRTMFKKDGEPYKGALVLSKEEIRELTEFALNKSKIIAQDIRNGNIAVEPTSDAKNNLPCSYCQYTGICRRDLKQQRGYQQQKRKVSLSELVHLCKPETPDDSLSMG